MNIILSLPTPQHTHLLLGPMQEFHLTMFFLQQSLLDLLLDTEIFLILSYLTEIEQYYPVRYGCVENNQWIRPKKEQYFS